VRADGSVMAFGWCSLGECGRGRVCSSGVWVFGLGSFGGKLGSEGCLSFLQFAGDF
jgi:hypothetical protein